MLDDKSDEWFAKKGKSKTGEFWSLKSLENQLSNYTPEEVICYLYSYTNSTLVSVSRFFEQQNIRYRHIYVLWIMLENTIVLYWRNFVRTMRSRRTTHWQEAKPRRSWNLPALTPLLLQESRCRWSAACTRWLRPSECEVGRGPRNLKQLSDQVKWTRHGYIHVQIEEITREVKSELLVVTRVPLEVVEQRPSCVPDHVASVRQVR